MLEPAWGSLLDKFSPLTVDMAFRRLFIERALLHTARSLTRATTTRRPRIVLNVPAKGRAGVVRHIATPKRKAATTVESLRGSDASGD